VIGIRGSAFPRSGTIAPRELLRWVLAGMALLGASASLRAQENAACLKCHGADRAGLDSESRSVAKVVDVGALGKSVHSRVDCVGCHADLSGVDKFPHSAKLLPVDCGQCHEDAAGVYVKHGRMQKGKDADFPACFQPPVWYAAEQMQFVAALVDQRVAEQEGEIRRARGVWNGVVPGDAFLVVNPLGERVRGR